MVLMVLGGVLFARWVYGVHALLEGGNGLSGPVPVEQTMYVGENVVPASGGPTDTLSVDLRSVTPRITTNTADADVTVLMCTVGLDPIGATTATGPYCTSVSAFHPGNVVLGSRPGSTDIVVAVRPHRAGTVHVEGLDVNYHLGIRRGHAHTGTNIQVVTK